MRDESNAAGRQKGMYYDVQHALEDTLADVRMDEDGEMRIIGIEGTVSLRINLYEEEELNLLEDLVLSGTESFVSDKRGSL